LHSVRQEAVRRVTEGARVLRDEVEEIAESKKDAAIEKIEGLGEAVGETARKMRQLRMDPIAEYVEAATEMIEGSADYLQERDVTEIIDDAAKFVRRHPAPFVGALLVVGFATARFLKASDPSPAFSGQSAGRSQLAQRRGRGGATNSRRRGNAQSGTGKR